MCSCLGHDLYARVYGGCGELATGQRETLCLGGMSDGGCYLLSSYKQTLAAHRYMPTILPCIVGQAAN